MPRTISAEGRTIVVPDDATDDEINDIFGPPSQSAAAANPSLSSQLGEYVGSAGSRIAHNFSPSNIVESAKNLIHHPIDTLTSGMAENRAKVGGDIEAAGKEPDLLNKAVHYGDALVHGIGGAVPVLGPVAAHAYDATSGTPEQAGSAMGDVVSLRAPQIISKLIPKTVRPFVKPSLDPTEQAAVDFANRRNIPLDAATATGNKAVQNIQGAAQNMPLVAGAAKKSRLAQTAAMTNVGDQIADTVAPPTNPQLAGRGMQDAFNQHIDTLGAKASGAYGRLEAIENASQPVNVQIGTKPSKILGANGQPINLPVNKAIIAPISMVGAKQILGPIEAQLQQILTPAEQQYSKGLTAIRGVLNGPDALSASAADQTLSGLKSILRDPSVPPKTKFLVGKITDELSPAIDYAVSRLGPTAAQALQDGRALTAAKYAAKGTLGELETEPVRLVEQLTRGRDTQVNLLNDVAATVPHALPAIGRAVLDEMIDKAFAEAGQARPGTVLTKWNQMGPVTKQLLFKDPRTIQDIGSFFTLAKKMAENPNPSGSAYVGTLATDGMFLVASPHAAIPYVIGRTVLGRILTSPGGARLLTRSMNLPKGSISGGIAALNLLRMAGTDAHQEPAAEPPPEPQPPQMTNQPITEGTIIRSKINPAERLEWRNGAWQPIKMENTK